MAVLGIIGSALAGAAQGGGNAGVQAGLQLQKQFGEEELLKLKSEADLKLGTTLENLRSTNRVSEHTINAKTDISNIRLVGAAQTEVEVGREAATRPGAVARSGEEAKIKAEAPFKASLDYADRLREAAKLDAEAKSDSDRKNLIKLTSDPQYMKGLRAQAIATHVDSPATMAQAELAKFQLGQARTIAGLQEGYATAKAAGNKVAEKTYADRIDAMGYTGKWQTVAPLLTAGTTLMKAAENEIDPASKAAMQAQAAMMFTQAGIGRGESPAGGRNGWDPSSGKVFKDGKEIGAAQSEVEARRKYSGYGTPEAPKASKAAPDSAKIIGSRAPATPQQPDYVTQSSDMTQKALQNPNLTTEQKAALSLQLQKQLKAEGKWDRQ